MPVGDPEPGQLLVAEKVVERVGILFGDVPKDQAICVERRKRHCSGTIAGGAASRPCTATRARIAPRADHGIGHRASPWEDERSVSVPHDITLSIVQ